MRKNKENSNTEEDEFNVSLAKMEEEIKKNYKYFDLL